MVTIGPQFKMPRRPEIDELLGKVRYMEQKAVNWLIFNGDRKPEQDKPKKSKLATVHANYLQLTKFRLSALVVVTTALGYLLALRNPLSSVIGHWSLTLFGAFCVVAAANAFNQVWERDADALMGRTANRPLPAKRMAVAEALFAAIIMAIVGLVVLIAVTCWFTAALAVFALALYVLAYTPLKRKTEFCTLIGAIAGAIPPVMGWTAVRNELSMEAALLFAVQFLWQFPHFWAIAWMYRDDYQRAGFRMLPVAGDERAVARQTFYYTLSLVTLSAYPALMGMVKPVYLLGAAALGMGLLGAAFRFGQHPTCAHAKKLMLTADAYLPALLMLWFVCRSLSA